MCVCDSGGCRLTVTGRNLNVSSTAVLRLTNDQLDIHATATPVRLLRMMLCTDILVFSIYNNRNDIKKAEQIWRNLRVTNHFARWQH